MWWVLALFVLNTLFTLWVAITQVHTPARALTWALICMVVPVVGFAAFLVVSRPLRIQKAMEHQGSPAVPTPSAVPPPGGMIASTLQSLCGFGAVSAEVRVLINGDQTYDALLQAIHKARHSIDIEYYIYRDDSVGRQFTEALLARAAAGVKIRFLRDGWGSHAFPKRELSRLAQAGISCRTMFPIRFPWLRRSVNHRDHCKIVVIDEDTAFAGGINIGLEYTGRKPQIGPWRDTHLHLLGKSIAKQLRSVFEKNWNVATPETLSRGRQRRDTLVASRRELLPLTARFAGEWAMEFEHAEWNASHPADQGQWHTAVVQTVNSGPVSAAENIRHLFFLALTESTRSVDITTPYFVPDADIVMALKAAAARGVQIRLLVPKHPDHKLIGLASKTYYEDLLKAGLKIFLYDSAVLHAKSMTVDGTFCVIGAANYDMRSFRLNFEVCQAIYDQKVSAEVTWQFEQDLQHATKLTLDQLADRSFTARTLEKTARLLAPLL